MLIFFQMPALCSYGAKRLLENGRNLILIMVDSMNIFYSLSIQLEGFRLAQTLTVGIFFILFYNYYYFYIHILIPQFFRQANRDAQR